VSTAIRPAIFASLTPTEFAASTRSAHVLSSIGTPSLSRAARVRRSASPGASTGSPGFAGGDASTKSTNRRASARTPPAES
jgi:hypothetical protein